MAQNQDRPMRKKMADFCRQAPRRYPVFCVLLSIIILVLIIWFIPHWQVPKSGLSLKDRLHQINENRKTVAQIVGGVFILVGLYIAWVRSEAARKMAEVNREQQLTDLYVKAIEQLGSENLQIRLGGIYALERIARESPKDHWPIMEVLTAFVREKAPLKKEAPIEGAAAEESSVAPDAIEKAELKTTLPTTKKKPATDIQAVLTVLGRTAVDYAQEGEERCLDLQATHLVGAALWQANFQGVYLDEANLQWADLEKADLQWAELINANLQEADLKGSNLQWATLLGANIQFALLWGADLQNADLKHTYLRAAKLLEANLQQADLSNADLQGAIVGDANLQGAVLQDANLQGAILRNTKLHEAVFLGANLQGADFRGAKGLTAEQIAEAYWDETTRWPEGFSPPPRQGNGEEKE